MNDILVFLEDVQAAAWVYLWVVFAGAVALLIFDRRPKASAAMPKHESESHERMAA